MRPVVNLGREELRFLETIPWRIDGLCQPPELVIRVLANEAQRFFELPNQVLVSLVAPLHNSVPDRLEELILSVRCQSWGCWELLLVDDGGRSEGPLEIARKWARRDARVRLLLPERACGSGASQNFAIDRCRGDFVGLLEHDTILHPAALGILARRVNLDPRCNFFFANEAHLDATSRRVGPFFRKPPFDLFTLWRTNYIGGFAAVRRGLLELAHRDGSVFRAEYDGVEDHDLFLRLAMTDRLVAHHEPLFLSYRRTRAIEPGREQTRLRMIAGLLTRLDAGARVEGPPPSVAGRRHPSIRMSVPGGERAPSLLVVVLFRDHAEMTIACLASLEHQEHTLDVHVVLVNNRSADPTSLPALRSWIGGSRRNRYEVVDDDGPFNFARINNGVFESHGAGKDLLLFLNNDVELQSPDCLQALAAHLLHDEGCAFCGIRLVFPDDGAIQHAGVIVGETMTGSGYHLATHALEPRFFPEDEHVIFAVTFACAMTRCRTYRELGLLEEIRWPNGYGDIELCARALELGYHNHYIGTLVAIHHESKTRGRCVEEFELTSLYERHAATLAWWRVRTLSVEDGPTWRVVLPLRYKAADFVSRLWRRIAGPAHDPLQRGVLALARRLRAARRRIGSHPEHPRASSRDDRDHRAVSARSRHSARAADRVSVR